MNQPRAESREPGHELRATTRDATPFAEFERAAGASFVERFGISLPEQFGDPDAEYQAVRRGVGLIDLSFRGLLEVCGTERVRWLNGQVTSDVAKLRPGEVQRAAVLNSKGHLLADLAVYGLADAIRVDVQRDRLATVTDAFERHIIADDVRVEDLTPAVARVMVVGKEAPAFLAEAAGPDAAGLGPWRHVACPLAGVPATVAASRWLGLPGFDVTVAREGAGALWRALVEAGRLRGLRPVGMRALEWLRVEAGWPWPGLDFDETTLLMEALTPAHVSLTKGCYVGQEVVIRIEHQGHLNRKLAGLLVSGSIVPAAKATILDGETRVGTVTTAAWSPGLQRIIALGYLRREHLTPGTRVRVAAGDGVADAEVAPLPFVGQV